LYALDFWGFAFYHKIMINPLIDMWSKGLKKKRMMNENGPHQDSIFKPWNVKSGLVCGSKKL
jgi:hypothetical protein